MLEGMKRIAEVTPLVARLLGGILPRRERAFAVGDLPVRRIYPMDGGEGHFVAKFQRVGENVDKPGAFTAYLSRREEAEFQGLFEELFTCPWPGSAARFGDRVVLLPQGLPELSG